MTSHLSVFFDKPERLKCSWRVRKIAKSDFKLFHVCLFVRPSVHTEHRVPHWMDFHEVWYLNVFRNSIEKVQASLKFGNNTLREDRYTFLIVSRSILFRVRNFSPQTVDRTKQNTFYFQQMLFGNHVVYEIIWENTVQLLRYGACAFHTGHLRLHTHTHTHTHNM